MINARPVVGFTFGLIGGIFILIGAIFATVFSRFFPPFGLLGLAFGILVIVGSVMLYVSPQQHVAWGVLVLIFSIASIVSTGGFIVGLALGVVGGATGIAWRPGGPWQSAGPSMGPYGVPLMTWRMCMGCGRQVPWAYNVCPMCGTSAPVAPWVPPGWVAQGASPPTTASVARPAETGTPVPAAAPAYPVPMPTPVVVPFAPPTQEAIKAPCPTCEEDAEWLPFEKRWYCKAESRYF